MSRALTIGVATFSSFVAMLGLLLTAASLSLGRLDGVAFYLALTVVSVWIVAKVMRRDRRRRRAAEALLPPEQRPQRRVPRRPITFPLAESAITFALWYAAALLIDTVVVGRLSAFTAAAIAPFAAFMLTVITIAGRHMMFRLTADEEQPPR